MFSRLLSSIKESIMRTSSHGHATNNKRRDDTPRLSVSEEVQTTLDDQSMLSKFSTNHSMPIHAMDKSDPIPIVGSVPSSNGSFGRRGSLFGISSVAYDDYVQKDLISSSWS